MPHRPATEVPRIAVGAGEVERQPASWDENVLGGLRDVPIPDVHAFDHRVGDGEGGVDLHLVLDEAHALLHSEAGARTMQTIFRIGRALRAPWQAQSPAEG